MGRARRPATPATRGPADALEDPAAPARTRIWIKASDAVPDDPVINTCVLTYASDLTLLGVSLVPHGL